eukprot:Gb_08971 [translate_table: standard]
MAHRLGAKERLQENNYRTLRGYNGQKLKHPAIAQDLEDNDYGTKPREEKDTLSKSEESDADGSYRDIEQVRTQLCCMGTNSKMIQTLYHRSPAPATDLASDPAIVSLCRASIPMEFQEENMFSNLMACISVVTPIIFYLLVSLDD